jgi:hypothetical protein
MSTACRIELRSLEAGSDTVLDCDTVRERDRVLERDRARAKKEARLRGPPSVVPLCPHAM